MVPKKVKGRIINKNGYVDLLKPEHPNSRKSGYIAEHRYVMSQHIGRPLRKDEIVHHINENKSDNRIENLQIMTTEEHTRLHTKGNKDRFIRKGRTQCIYPECYEMTSSKYKLCRKHYKIQWQRFKKGSISNIQDTNYSWKGHAQETKENLSDLAKKQNRKNGKFSK